MIQTQYNDNIYFDNDNERDDIIIRTQPSLNIQKDYRDHEWQLNLSTEDTRYLDNTQESAQTYAIDTHLKIAATNNIKLLFTGETAKNILARSTPGSTRFTDKPTSFNVSGASAGASYRFSRFNLTLVGEHERRSYKDGVSSTSSNPVIFSTSNHKTSSATATLHYNFLSNRQTAPDHTAFLGFRMARQNFDHVYNAATNTETSEQRNNNRISILGGFNTRYKNLVIGGIGFRYIKNKYDSPNAGDVEIIDINSDIDFLLTQKLTLSAQASRKINQDNNLIQGFIESQYELGLEYEFAHDIYGRLYSAYDINDFINDVRKDKKYRAGAEMRLLHGQHLESRFGIDTRARDSNIIGNDYDQLSIRYGLTGKL